ncbi:MAG: LamG-like jellyroll fold domain-containing protein [Planctomycetota bacterium]|jgi:hypothetical protein
MHRRVRFASLLLTLGLCCWLHGAEEGLVAWWKFDEQKEGSAADSVANMDDAIKGNLAYVEGASGSCGRFDGYTTYVIRQADAAPKLVDAFTIEAWIAPQTYSWNWTAIVDQAGDVAGEEPTVGEPMLMPGLTGAKWNEPDFTNPDGTDRLEHVSHDWTGTLNDWTARWRGYIEAPFSGEVTFSAEVDNGLKLEIDQQTVIDGLGRGKAREGKMSLVKGRRYPIVLSYLQDGDPSYLRLYWNWAGQDKTLVAASALSHGDKDKRYVQEQELGRKGPPKERNDRLFFGIDSEGHIGMKLMVDGQLKKCISDIRLPLLRWAHVVGTFDKNEGINLYVNGKSVGSLAAKGSVTPTVGYNLLIGKSQKKMSPVNSERGPSERLHSHMIFDGLIDEVKLYNRALSIAEVNQSYSAVRPPREQPLEFRLLPSGPKDLPPRFGASYCRLRYSDDWEMLWRVGEHPDILVRFDLSPARLLFWRGTGYGAVWVTEKDRWMGDQSVEATGNSTGWGCSEHMSDKQCRYSHVRLIENHDARVVVHWRYAVSDIVYGISRIGLDGWGEWADEYYYIYPDAVSTRKQILHSNVLRHEWQETIVLHQPGTRPEDNLELGALTWGNMDGQQHTYSWATPPSGERKPSDPTIQITNLKDKYKPFIIYEPKSRVKLMGTGAIEEQWSHFTWWNHWPVGQVPNDGRRTGVADRPAHTSLSQSIEDSPVIKHDPEKGTYTAVHLCGMSDKTVEALVPLARSWNYPAELRVVGSDFTSRGYDRHQRAYVITCANKGKPSALEFELAASEKSPVVNPAFVVEDWGQSGARLKINGKTVKRGKKFRLGHDHTMEGSDLIVWVKTESTKPIKISLVPEAD